MVPIGMLNVFTKREDSSTRISEKIANFKIIKRNFCKHFYSQVFTQNDPQHSTRSIRIKLIFSFCFLKWLSHLYQIYDFFEYSVKKVYIIRLGWHIFVESLKFKDYFQRLLYGLKIFYFTVEIETEDKENALFEMLCVEDLLKHSTQFLGIFLTRKIFEKCHF